MFSSDIAQAVSRRKGATVAAPPRVFLTRYESQFYLQPGSSTVCPGGWHFAPPSFGPLLLLPGPKSGFPKAAAGTESAKAPASSTAAIFLRIVLLLLPTTGLSMRFHTNLPLERSSMQPSAEGRVGVLDPPLRIPLG